MCEDCEEEKARKICWQGRNEDAAGDEANLKTKLIGKVKGAKTRWTDILKFAEVDLGIEVEFMR